MESLPITDRGFIFVFLVFTPSGAQLQIKIDDV